MIVFPVKTEENNQSLEMRSGDLETYNYIHTLPNSIPVHSFRMAGRKNNQNTISYAELR